MILAANFKANHTRSSTKEYIEKLNVFLNTQAIDSEIYIFPPYTALNNYEGYKCKIGVQNAYPIESGSFTGEIGLQQLSEFNIKTIIIGHSERRHILGENQEIIKKKFDFFKKNNFKIFYCIGETIEIRKTSFELIKDYLQFQLEGIDLLYENLIIAYEPVWAIGTGVSAKTEEIEEIISFLSSKTKAPLLYGGSVKPANIEDIVSISGCSGALIGTASWDIESFCKIISKVENLKTQKER